MYHTKTISQQYLKQNRDSGKRNPLFGMKEDIALCTALARPTIQSDLTLVIRDIVTGKQLSVNDGVSLLFGGNDYMISGREYTFQTLSFWWKKTTSTDTNIPLGEIWSKSSTELSTGTCTSGTIYVISATEADHFGSGLVENDTFTSDGTETLDTNNKVREIIATIALVDNVVTPDGLTNVSVTNIERGDWIFTNIQADEVTGYVTIGKYSQNFGNISMFAQYLFSDQPSVSDLTWLANNPNATPLEIRQKFGYVTTPDGAGGLFESGLVNMHVGQGSGSYWVDLAQPVGNELMQNPTFDGNIDGWSTSGTGLFSVSYNNDNLHIECTAAGSLTVFNTGEPAIFNIGKKYITDVNIVVNNNNRTVHLMERKPTDVKSVLSLNENINIFGIVTADTFLVVGNVSAEFQIGDILEFSIISSKEPQAATINGATWQTSQTTGYHTAIAKGHTQEVNGERMFLIDIGDGTDIFGNTIDYEYVKGLNLDGRSYVVETITDTIQSIMIRHEGDLLELIDGTYYVNGVEATPDEWPVYVDGNDYYIGKTGAATFAEKDLQGIVLAKSILTTQQRNLIEGLL